MQPFITKLNKKIDNQLQVINLEEQDILIKAQKCIQCIKKVLNELKSFVLDYNFIDEAEEIYFFKKTKPELFSKLIYFTKVYNIESRRPSGSLEIQEKFLRHELEKITSFFNSHLQFYQYYRMNSTFLDDKCFLRGKEDLHLFHDSLLYFVEPDFSTSHDIMVAKIMSNDMLEVFLNTELENLNNKANNPSCGQIGISGTNILQWTESKTALVELIYALQASTAINKGDVDIKELVSNFELVFNVRLTDIYRTYVELKNRNIPTKFIDNLKASLLRKIEEDS
ncbi:MAG: RteC domain-containing protein [Paludibacter sp.]